MNYQGGSIEETANPKNNAPVTEVTVTQSDPGKGDWVVVMEKEPAISNYTKGMNLTYNSKGTSNPNADNYLTVKQVVGPAKYKCTGNFPINI